MGTRFGSSYSVRQLSRRARWIIACLGGIIVFLCSMLAVLLTEIGDLQSQPASSGVALAADHPPAATVAVLIARRRIEVGEQLGPGLFDEQKVLESLVPQDALRADQRDFLLGKYATTMVESGVSLSKAYFSNKKPISALYIPPGYRAFTIVVDPRSGVEGYARPGSRVDVLWSFIGDDQLRQVLTVVRYSRVLSVAGATDVEAVPSLKGVKTTTVTLLVTEQDAKRLELARSLGMLSLSLVGDTEPVKATDADRPVTLADIVPPVHQPEDPLYNGSIYYRDPLTGEMKKYLLDDKGRWRPAPTG